MKTILTENNKKNSSPLLSKKTLIQIHQSMVTARLLDEQLIHIYKKGQGYFWIGSPGEEGFSAPLGLLVKKGQGLDFDWLHLHYRCTGTVIAMGLKTIDALRLMMSKKTDPFTGGRNFVHHYNFPEWNIPPITSAIETQYSIALGTARAQAQNKAQGITIATGGDAGTALGDFASSLVWSSRPALNLPLLIIVLNNRWGISTDYDSQHGEKKIYLRAKAFGIKTYEVNGNDPIQSYLVLKESLNYVRENKKPAVIEAHVSRLYGHSSASGAAKVTNEPCCLKNFEAYLTQNNILSEKQISIFYEQIRQKLNQESKKVFMEENPSPKSVWNFVYADNENADWRKF